MKEYTRDRDKRVRGLCREIQPTLVVAIGGTGVAAAKRAKAFMSELLPDAHPFFAVRAFDADAQSERLPRLIENAEFTNLSHFNALSLFKAVQERPEYAHWRAWVPPRLSAQQITGGVGGIRPKGRLCYFRNRSRIEEAVKDGLNTILRTVEARQLRDTIGISIDPAAGLDIHLVSSLCGGTGSGMFLDIAYDVRRWARDITGSDVKIIGHLVLPGAFQERPVIHNLLRANAYVALQELDHFMHAGPERPWRVTYKSSESIEDDFPPFDICYLLDGLREGGTVDIDTLTAMIGEAIVNLTVHEVGRSLKSGITNLTDTRLIVTDHRERLCCYSSYGLLTIEIPKEFISQNLGVTLAQDAVSRLVATPEKDNDQIEKKLEDFRTKLQLVPSRVQNDLDQPNPDLAEVWDGLGVFTDKSRTINLFQAKWAEYRRSYLDTQRQRLQAPIWQPRFVRETLREHMRELVGTQAGIEQCQMYLHECVKTLEELQHGLENAARDAEREKQKAEQEGRLPALGTPEVETFDLGVTQQLMCEGLYQEALKLILQKQHSHIDDVIRIIQRDFIDGWDRIKTLFHRLELENEIEENAYYRTRGTRVPACPMKHFMEQIAPNKEHILEEILEGLATDLDQWHERDAVSLRQHFYKLCKDNAMQDIERTIHMDCEQLSSSWYSPEEFNSRLGLLMAQAGAFWQIEDGYPAADNKKEISCVGVNADSNIYNQLRSSNRELLAINEHRQELVPLFRTEHGVSLVGLRPLSNYRQAFIDSISIEQRWDFHFFLDRCWVTEFEFPDEDEKLLRPLQVFSLSEKFGRVARDPRKGYRVGLNEAGRHADFLGRSRRIAFMALCEREGVLGVLDEELAVRQETEEIDLHQLEDWVQTLQQRVSVALDEIERKRGRVKVDILKQDIFQIHSEIRAIRTMIKDTEIGI